MVGCADDDSSLPMWRSPQDTFPSPAAPATLGVSYTGQIASKVHDHAAKGRFSWKFSIAEQNRPARWGNGGRDRDRTCDPYHVKVVLFR